MVYSPNLRELRVLLLLTLAAFASCSTKKSSPAQAAGSPTPSEEPIPDSDPLPTASPSGSGSPSPSPSESPSTSPSPSDSPSPSSPVTHNLAKPFDFDGDGTSDLIALSATSGMMNADAMLNAQGFLKMPPFRFAEKQGAYSNAQVWFEGDFDGDHRADIAKVFNDSNLASIDTHLSKGNFFQKERWTTQTGAFFTSMVWFRGDFNGDHMTDIAKFWNDQNMWSVDVHVSQGTSFSMQRWGTKQGGYNTNQNWVSGDFNGDGMSDFAKFWNDGGSLTADVHLSNGKAFEMQRWATKLTPYSVDQKWFVADANGDGKSDLVKVFGDSTGFYADVLVSSGSSFSVSRWASKQGGYWAEQMWLTGDFNGDGKDDLMKYWNDGGQFTADVHLSSGSAYSMVRWATKATSYSASQVVLARDFTGTGRTGLARLYAAANGNLAYDSFESNGRTFVVTKFNPSALVYNQLKFLPD